ncbi:MAG: HAD family hydrolase [Methanomassiliicoccaceae archaeon]|nr:HAD family hydrolase [Methanomassiliicoccaceae archaeon]
MREYDFYIFDLDNTLVDSRTGYEAAFMSTFVDFGIPYDPGRYDDYIRTPLSEIFSRHRPDSPEACSDFVSAVMDAYDGVGPAGLMLFPDAERCLARLSRKGRVLGVVSNAYMSQVMGALSALGIEGMFTSVVGRDSVESPKPDPEPVLLCLSEMGAPPGDSLMVGDSMNDVLAGKGAGVFSVLIDRPGGGFPCGGCDARISSLDEL